MSCDISVIIPSYNSSDKIPRCLAALDEQQTGASFEIIVVDSSEDGTGETLERREEIRLIRSEGRVFPGTARNRGAGAASGLILAFVDADCIPSPQWVQRIWEARPDLSNTLVGGCVANGTPESSIGSAEYFSELSALLPGSPQREVDFLPAANISVGASLFREVGGFKDYEKGSDVTLGKDCREKGIRLPREGHPARLTSGDSRRAHQPYRLQRFRAQPGETWLGGREQPGPVRPAGQLARKVPARVAARPGGSFRPNCVSVVPRWQRAKSPGP